MPVNNLIYQGINRSISDFASAGACEELINMRPTGSGLIPVKPFSVKMENVSYNLVIVHKTAYQTNYIGVEFYSGTELARGIKFWILNDDGTHRDENPFYDFTYSIKNNSVKEITKSDIHYAYTGNIICFSIMYEENDLYHNLSFIWNSEQYIEQQIEIPYFHFDLTAGVAEKRVHNLPYFSDTELVQLKDAINNALEGLEEEDETFTFGPVIVAVAFKTKDGNTFWTDRWYLYDPLPNMKSYVSESSMPYYMTAAEVSQNFPSYPRSEPAVVLVPTYIPNGDYMNIELIGQEITAIISGLSTALTHFDWDEETSMLSSIEIYSSRPARYIDPFEHFGAKCHWAQSASADSNSILMPILPYGDMDLENQLFYHQKSVTMRELKQLADDGTNTYSFALRFGGSLQATNKTLEVDSGATTRFGKILAYNNRYHFFDSVSKTVISDISFCFEDNSTTRATDVFAIYSDGTKDEMLYLGSHYIPYTGSGANLVIAPSLNIKEVITWDSQDFVQHYPMTPSSKYNYSIFTGGLTSVGYNVTQEMIDAKTNGKSYVIRDEDSVISVTEQYNPFVFKVEHSYLAPGRVIDLQPQMVTVKDVSYGDYPLNIFTDRGVYALLRGSGTVLYGAVHSVSNLISESNSASTEAGTFFIAAGDLWVVSADKAILISDALSLGPHMYIRDCAGYKAISEQTYDVSEIVSKYPFKQYVKNATLSYNRYRDELYISNDDNMYTYVLSIKYRQWFKISGIMHQDTVGSSIANMPRDGGMYIIDFSNEIDNTSVLVHMQTRPILLGGQYTHFHRVVSMIRSALGENDQLIVALYGSDDLQNWKLLCYADRSNVTISQIRTTSAARSWRYHTVCVGGIAPTDTDFGPIIVEHEPVVRRIG